MALLSFKEILMRADQGGYAVGAFNVSDVETTEVILGVASQEKSPVIIQIWGGVFEAVNAKTLVGNVRKLVEQADVPAALHLDHCDTYEDIKKGIDLGFTSVMIDASVKPFAENVAITKKVVELARLHNVDVESELGHVGSGEDSAEDIGGEALLTDPAEAVSYLEQTGVDALAVAIGTAHGLYKVKPKLDLERLSEIKQKIKHPLVLHGGSDTPDEGVSEAIRLGINKINVATELNVAFFNALMELAESKPRPHFPANLLYPARQAVAPVVRRKINLFGSKGKA